MRHYGTFPLLNKEGTNTYVIAEAEINHNGDLETALKMVEVAKKAGAQAIKFQYILAEEIATPNSSYHSLFKKVELTHKEFEQIFDRSQVIGIDCFVTVPGLGTLERVLDLKPPVLKIGSTNLTNIPLLEKVGATGIPVLLSTGLGTLGEIETALNALNAPHTPVGIFHRTIQYPACMSDINLRAINTLQTAFPINPVGYSDHTEGEWAAIAAVTLGACMIEKHFTLDRSQDGPDHAFSTDPEQFTRMVRAIRQTEAALGNGIKKPAPAEASMIRSARRYLVAARDIRRGTTLNGDNLTCRRIPPDREGVEPAMLQYMVGWKAPKDYSVGEPLTWGDFKKASINS